MINVKLKFRLKNMAQKNMKYYKIVKVIYGIYQFKGPA